MNSTAELNLDGVLLLVWNVDPRDATGPHGFDSRAATVCISTCIKTHVLVVHDAGARRCAFSLMSGVQVVALAKHIEARPSTGILAFGWSYLRHFGRRAEDDATGHAW